MAGRNSQQSRIQYSAGGTAGTFSEIEEVTDIAGPDGSANTIDTTHLRSTTKEYLAGLGDFGTLTLTCNYIGATNQIELFDMFSSNADPRSFVLELPTAADASLFDAFAFSASVTKWSLGSKVDDKQVLNITLKVTGDLDLTQNQATVGTP